MGDFKHRTLRGHSETNEGIDSLQSGMNETPIRTGSLSSQRAVRERDGSAFHSLSHFTVLG